MLKKILKKISNRVNKKSILSSKELIFANVFHDTIIDSKWLKNKSFSPISGAANYSFLYILFRVIDEINPNNILEFGLGQTTKITTQYVKNKKQEAVLDVVDHVQDWIDCFSKQLEIPPNAKFHQLDLIEFEYEKSINDKYKDLQKVTLNKKYDLIIIDGPVGGNKLYPRSNILDLIPNNLSENFVIILDDAERIGEKNLATSIFKSLKENNIKYYAGYTIGLKTQLIIFSEKFKYLSFFC